MSTSHSSPTALQPMSMPARKVPTIETQHVYNLTVLVQQLESGEMRARAANIAIEDVRAGSIRGALSQMVAATKSLIAERVARDESIPWIEPPVEPSESESRFMVPLHL